MKLIPLIKIYKRKFVKSNYNNIENIKELLHNFKDDFIYLLDYDGINKNRPNLCIFQKLSKNHDLWVDSGPRVIGDVVDSVVAGASKITIRKNLIKNVDTLSINELLENEIYINISPNFFQSSTNDAIKTNFNGFVILEDEILNNFDFKEIGILKNLLDNNVTYLYLSNKENLHYIRKYIFKGLLIDIEKFEEFENIGI